MIDLNISSINLNNDLKFIRNDCVNGPSHQSDLALKYANDLINLLNILTSPQSGYNDQLLLKLVIQSLSNLITNHHDNQLLIWSSIRNLLPRLMKFDNEILLTSLIFIRNLCSNTSVHIVDERALIVGLFDVFLKLENVSKIEEEGNDENNDEIFHLSFVIICLVYENENIESLWNTFDIFIDEPVTPTQSAFIKCLDAYYHSKGYNVEELSQLQLPSFIIRFLIKTFDFAQTSMASSIQYDVEPDPRLALTIQSAIVATEIILSYQPVFDLNPSHPILESGRSSILPEITVKTLERAIEFMPSIHPFSESSKSEDPLRQFANFKPTLIRLLASLAGTNQTLQSRIGAAGGLKSCMNCAHVDMRESSMRESALFTLSVLLKNNVDNQNRVRELGETPIGVLDPEGVLKPFPEKNIRQI